MLLPSIFTLKVQVPWFPVWPTAWHVTLVSPIQNWLPDSASHVIVGICPELAVTCGSVKNTVAYALPKSVSTVWFPEQAIFTGASCSVNETLKQGWNQANPQNCLRAVKSEISSSFHHHFTIKAVVWYYCETALHCMDPIPKWIVPFPKHNLHLERWLCT